MEVPPKQAKKGTAQRTAHRSSHRVLGSLFASRCTHAPPSGPQTVVTEPPLHNNWREFTHRARPASGFRTTSPGTGLPLKPL